MDKEKAKKPQGVDVDIDKLNAALSGKIHGCPLCGAPDSFTALPQIMELRQYFEGGFLLGPSSVVPLVVITCTNCGNTVLVNAIASGLLDNKPDNQKKNEG